MSDSIRIQLDDYYRRRHIHPEQFDCRHQSLCRSFAYQQVMTETKMSMVGSQYGRKYPKIVVLSLDPPYGNRGNFVEPLQRTTVHVSIKHEADDYTLNRPNVHWALTQIVVKDLLCLFGHEAQPGAAVVVESYSRRPIENVSAYFAHVNIAKCSMNNVGKAQADRKVHETCGSSYIQEELAILDPDILVQNQVTFSVTAR